MKLLVAILVLSLATSTNAKALPSAPILPATITSPLPDDAMGVTIHRLANGLTVYLSPNKGQPRMTAHIVVRTGSKNDPADATGQAHYLEHMLFKGTTLLGTTNYEKEASHLARIKELYDKRVLMDDSAGRAKIDALIDAENVAVGALAVPNEIGKFYRVIGAAGLNAHTSNEETVYVVDLPANRLEQWATMEAERFSHPVFRLFPGELEAVYEEKNRSMDNAEWIVREEVERRLFKKHPYGTQTTIGTIAHLKNPSLTTMQEFYERWYVPNNMAIVLSGDFNPERALTVITRSFGAWKPKSLPAPQAWPLPKPVGEEHYEVRYEDEEKVVVAWPTVPKSHSDADALTVMDMVMDNSVSGLVNLRLNQAQRVKVAGSYPEMLNDAGGWYLWAVTRKGQTPEDALKLLLETAEGLKNGEFDESDLSAVITDFEISQKRRLESNDARAAVMDASFISNEPWEREITRLDRLRGVTKEDVMRVARKYLGPDRIVVYRRNGKPEILKIDKPGFTHLDIDPARESTFMRQLLGIDVAPIEPRWLVRGKDYQIFPVEGGRLYAAKNPYNDLFSLTLRFERGWRQERRLCHALELLGLSGAGPYSADEFKKKLYGLGTSLFYSCGENDSAVTLQGLDRNFWPSLELMAQRFDWPNVSTDTLPQLIQVTLGDREDEKRNPDAVHAALGSLAMRGRESPVLGRLNNEELKKLDETALKSLIQNFPNWERRIGYVGPRSPAEVAKLLESRRHYKTPPAKSPLRLLKPARSRLLFTNRDMVQSQIGLSSEDGIFDLTRVVDALFYSQYMGGGMSSVIFQEIREARSLAYSAGGGHTVSADKGDEVQLWGFLGCQADKTPEALELMLKLLQDFPVSEKRFSQAAKAIEESYRANPVEFRSIPGTLMNWEDEGLPAEDPRPARFEKARKYAMTDLVTFAARFKGKPMTVWLLGPRDRVGMERLKALGDFEEKKVDDLFPY